MLPLVAAPRRRLDHRHQRHHEHLTPDARKPVEDREGQRELDLEPRPDARLGVDRDALERDDVAEHDVHADAAAREVGHRGRRREARREDELVDLGVGGARRPPR
ncbi:MAG: hypothetical protein U0325_36335 [Polyangiales bacterium]